MLRRLAPAATAVALLLTGCTTPGPGPDAPARNSAPVTDPAEDDLLKTAQLTLVTRCLARQGLALPTRTHSTEDPRLQSALFGTGPSELSLTLPTGATVTAHTDGCLADALHTLYGDQRRWFHAQVTVNNLRALAADRMKTDPAHRAAMARWTDCAATRPRGTLPDRVPPAVADRCAVQSGLMDVRARLEPAELARVRAERRDQLTTYQQLRTRALRRASALTGAQPAITIQPKGTEGT
ncbi:hypothetical protein ACH44C_01170 [Streptomyces purpureus]|uniref:hypothetical protein n=1 Tax=Streptomyces purpureus TaxID=1951 RepID=UPI000378C88D|nr:hypothetical protein [Streptomyces purpureus]